MFSPGLFEQLGGGPGGRLQRGNDTPPPVEPLVSFKAGKVELTKPEGSESAFDCKPNPTRGEIRLVWKNRTLEWQWYDRRAQETKDTFNIPDLDSTFERVTLPENDPKHKLDRVYVWTTVPKSREAEDPDTPKYHMYWMQDANAEQDDELVAKINQYLVDPASAAPEGETLRSTTASSGSSSATASGTSSSGTTAPADQVDALSSILENLGMPQQPGGTGAATSNATTGTTGAPNSNTLTLADLQGAMAGLQQQQQSMPGPPLNDVITPAAINGILEDEAACNRLLELLPPEQRSREHLADNLRSPQIQSSLRALTAALLPDEDSGDFSGMYSVLANFQLDPAHGHDAIAAGNPIQAFLECLQASVDKEQEGEEKNEDDDTPMEDAD